ncbi:MAG TPA: DinB family protein [Pirellulales bacterium]|jgi:uncharacterized damage-inducible protein DinB|nr:DinB family protein [Pirellulales bacterium]
MNEPSLSPKQIAFYDLDRELDATRPVLERLPEDRYDWKPHEKSMSLGQLALHVADLPDWTRVAIAQDELDAANAPRPPAVLKDRQELLGRFDRNVAALREAVARFDAATLNQPWTMRNGEQVMVTRPRALVYRVWCVNHLIHHRAQLCLYLRLLNVAVPTVYFNTADDPTWVFA